jgi:hypothetical protein
MKTLTGLFAGLMLAVSSQVFAYTNDFNAGVGMIVFYDTECQSMLPGKMAVFEQMAAGEGFPRSQWSSDEDAMNGYVDASAYSCKVIWKLLSDQGPILASFFR